MSVAQDRLTFAWLEVTGFCNLECHCYADSSPRGTHGTMTVPDWTDCMDQLAAIGANEVQFIGGEPTLYPHLAELIAHAHGAGLDIEVFSHLTHITDELWDTFTRYGVSLATSYYSDDAADHDQVTGRRGSHTRTRANIQRAQELGLRLRGGVITVHDSQRSEGALHDLAGLGLTEVGADHTRRFGRGSCGAQPTVGDLCGHCAHGKIAIGPDGEVWPCVIGRFITLGNVLRTPLAEIWNSASTAEARRAIEEAHRERLPSRVRRRSASRCAARAARVFRPSPATSRTRPMTRRWGLRSVLTASDRRRLHAADRGRVGGHRAVRPPRGQQGRA